MIKKLIVFILPVWILSCPPQLLLAETQITVLPLTLDYPFIRRVLIDQLYTQPNESAIVIDETTSENCVGITMWNPEVRSEGGLILIGSDIQVDVGVRILGKCVQTLKWNGYVEASQQALFDEADYRIWLKSVDFRVYTSDRKPIDAPGPVEDLIKTHVLPYFDSISLDLSFPVDEIRSMIPYFFSEEERIRVEEWMKSLKIGNLRVEKDAVRLDLSMTVETAPPMPSQPEKELTPDELDRFISLWETWDSFLVFQIKTLLEAELTDEERQSLFETLLEIRYGFVRALSEKTVGDELVREQFIFAWEQAGKILKTHLTKRAGQDDLVKYLAFFTASDALSVLDKIGPTLKLEISRDGLLRLARLLSQQGVELTYSPEVDANLRMLIGFGPPMDETGPSYPGTELPFSEEGKAEASADRLSCLMQRFLIPPVYAAVETASLNMDELKQWIVPKGDISPYLNRAQQILEKTADSAFAKSNLDPSYHDSFRLMILATAWQETCWRQFIPSGGKLKPIFSYNQSSVGIMQINERVWRGLYKVDSLRWNIEYNARAGAEILAHYLKDYALKKMDAANPLDQDTLSRAVYAMYNGGPGQFQGFLKRKKSRSFYESDMLFWDKYTMAKAGEFHKVSICLVGK